MGDYPGNKYVILCLRLVTVTFGPNECIKNMYVYFPFVTPPLPPHLRSDPDDGAAVRLICETERHPTIFLHDDKGYVWDAAGLY